MNRRIFILLAIITAAGFAAFFILQTDISPQNEKTSIQNGKSENNNSPSATIECLSIPIKELTEGPYYKTGTPKRQDIRAIDTFGIVLILEGYVLDTNCEPIANARIDFWQADGQGKYDNAGFELRGHQFTDSQGKYRLNTVIPGLYPGRTEHIHFKVRKNSTSREVTSQLFFPTSESNSTDSIYSESLLIKLGEKKSDGQHASFNFIIPN